MQKRLPDIQIQEIIQHYQAGMSPKDIGELYGIYNNSVTRILRKNGILRNQLIKISDEDTKYIIAAYTNGVSSETIATKLNRDGSTICRVLKRHGIKIRPATQNKRQYKIQEDFFTNIDTEEKAYFLGLLYADGSLSKRGNNIKLTLKDRDILEVFSNIIYGFVKISEEQRPDEDDETIIRTYYSVNIYSQNMHQDLCKLGCTPRKSFTIKFPEFMINNELCNHFIRGYFDGDGCISINAENRGVIDITSNIHFIQDSIKVIKNLLNIDCYFGINKKKPRSACLQICSQENVLAFLKYIYKNSSIYLLRKQIKTIEYYKLISDKNFKKISKNLNQNKYGTFYVPTWNNIQLTSHNIANLSSEDKRKVIEFIFSFYRKNGFPYGNLTDDELIKEFSVLKSLNIDSIEKDKKLSISNYTGTPIFKHFSSHFYEVKSAYSSKLSMLEAFNDDKLLIKTIQNRIDGNFTIHGNMIKQGLRNSRAAFMGSIFNTSVAKYLYSKYTKNGDIIYDYSMGFGQRLLGALSLPHYVKYIGIDPLEKSVNSNIQLFEFFNANVPLLNKDVELICSGSEQYCDLKFGGKVNFAFSSPPYFNLELYENNNTQAYMSGYNAFINIWWRQTVNNITKLLAEDGILALNIKDKVDKYNLAEDMCNIIKSYGFNQIDRYNLKLSKNSMFNNKYENKEKLEAIYIFKKEKSNENNIFNQK